MTNVFDALESAKNFIRDSVKGFIGQPIGPLTSDLRNAAIAEQLSQEQNVPMALPSGMTYTPPSNKDIYEDYKKALNSMTGALTSTGLGQVTSTGNTLNTTINIQPTTASNYVNITLSGIYSPGGWVRLMMDTDDNLFKKFIKRMDGKVIACIETIEQDSFVIPKQFALRYAYQNLRGKHADTVVDEIDLSMDDGEMIISFRDPENELESKQALAYDEVELDEFLAQLKEAREEDAEDEDLYISAGVSGYTGMSGSIGTSGYSGTSTTTTTTTATYLGNYIYNSPNIGNFIAAAPQSSP